MPNRNSIPANRVALVCSHTHFMILPLFDSVEICHSIIPIGRSPMAQSSNRYSQLLVEAEQAVAAIKDPELKRVAFEKILDTLLVRDEEEPSEKSNPRAKG